MPLNRARLRLLRGADLQASVLEYSQGKDLPEMRKNLQHPHDKCRVFNGSVLAMSVLICAS